MNAMLTYAPEFEDSAYVGCPLDAILDWCMGTPAGFAAFRHPTVNAMLRKIIAVWCEYLTSEASLHVINDAPRGWKSEAAQACVGMADFEHDPTDLHWDFGSWNDFFTRRFRPGARPIAAPDDNKVIVSPCESRPYRIVRDVKRQDDLSIKGQPYSLADMLAGDPAVDDFVGGVVYQAFLSALNYHRWHSICSSSSGNNTASIKHMCLYSSRQASSSAVCRTLADGAVKAGGNKVKATGDGFAMSGLRR